jgi:hypothetical protein
MRSLMIIKAVLDGSTNGRGNVVSQMMIGDWKLGRVQPNRRFFEAKRPLTLDHESKKPSEDIILPVMPGHTFPVVTMSLPEEERTFDNVLGWTSKRRIEPIKAEHIRVETWVDQAEDLGYKVVRLAEPNMSYWDQLMTFGPFMTLEGRVEEVDSNPPPPVIPVHVSPPALPLVHLCETCNKIRFNYIRLDRPLDRFNKPCPHMQTGDVAHLCNRCQKIKANYVRLGRPLDRFNEPCGHDGQHNKTTS